MSEWAQKKKEGSGASSALAGASEELFSKAFQDQILSSIRVIKDYPKKGILFRDVTTLLNHAKVFQALMDVLKQHYEKKQIDFVVGIESRGFIFGAPLAYALGAGFVPIRKKNKLPSATFAQSYKLEYGEDSIEIHQDAFCHQVGAHVLLVDDLLATGGTAQAALDLIARAGGKCVGALFLITLRDLYKDPLNVETLSVLEI